ncbi:32969_t:CDS:1, partial [Gigaspora margarita]
TRNRKRLIELPLLSSLFDIEDDRDNIADTCKPKNYFNHLNIHKTQWRTDVEKSQHLK